MSGMHPELHSKLKNFSIFNSIEKLASSDELAITFLEEIGLIPSRKSTAPTCCGLPMLVEDSRQHKLNWIWRCSSKGSKKKGSKSCRKTINPCIGTFFEGTSCRIDVRDVLVLIFCFVIQMRVNDVFEDLVNYRRDRGDSELSKSTIIDYYSYCREVAEVIISHSNLVLGGEGKTVQIDETFLTKRKYNRGRVTEQMTTTVLGLYCKEDKCGLFFKVNAKSKEELWPYIKKYVDFSTSRICTDSAKQYVGVEQMFATSTVHLRTNHSIGEFVDKSNPLNTINDLENQNKLLKASIKCRKTPKLLHQYMALYSYRNVYLKKYSDRGSKIMQFLLDIKKVYPGIIDGSLKEGLTLKEIDPPSFSSTEKEQFLPPLKKIRLEVLEDPADDIESAINKDDSDSDFSGEDDIF